LTAKHLIWDQASSHSTHSDAQRLWHTVTSSLSQALCVCCVFHPFLFWSLALDTSSSGGVWCLFQFDTVFFKVDQCKHLRIPLDKYVKMVTAFVISYKINA